jgi:hypothetical protein
MLGEMQGFACDLELYLTQNYVCMIIWRVKQLENQKTFSPMLSMKGIQYIAGDRRKRFVLFCFVFHFLP